MKSRLLALVSAVIGIALFIYVIDRTGLDQIWGRIGELGWGFLLIMIISSTRYLSRSLAWRQSLNPAERSVGIWALWRARLAGESLGDLTIGPVVAEPLRLVALGDNLSLPAGASSLAIENISYTISSSVMVMAGAMTMLLSFGLNESLRNAMIVALAVVAVVTLASVLTIKRRWKLGSNLISFICHWSIRDPQKLQAIEEKLDHLRSIEDVVFDFYARRPKDFLLVVLFHAAFHLAGVVEIYATMRLIGADLNPATAFLMETVNRAINIAFVFVPALVGVDEFGTKQLVEILGFDGSFGVALAIIRKIRIFFWIGVGLLFLAQARRKR